MFKNGIPITTETGRPVFTVLMPTNQELQQMWTDIQNSPNPALAVTERFTEAYTHMLHAFFPAIGAKVVGSIRLTGAEPEVYIEGWFKRSEYNALAAAFPTSGAGIAPAIRAATTAAQATAKKPNWRQRAKEKAMLAAQQAGKNGANASAGVLNKKARKKKGAKRPHAGA